MPPKRQDLTSMTFGRLTVVDFSYVGDWRDAYWLCACQCGGTHTVSGRALKSGRVRSCGCLQRENMHRLGKSRHRHGNAATSETPRTATYSSWTAMKNRCRRGQHRAFKYYAGRGIGVCSRWSDGEHGKSGFECFLEDMGERPVGMTLDRWPNNDGNYEPGNCRWATRSQQMLNRRKFNIKRSIIL